MTGPHRSVTFERDHHGRPLGATIEQGGTSREVARVAYDNAGNLTSVIQPQSDTHEQDFSSVGLLTSYVAPAVDGETAELTFKWDDDRRLGVMTHADGAEVHFERSSWSSDGPAARLRRITSGVTPAGTEQFWTTLSYADETCVGAEPEDDCTEERGMGEQVVNATRGGISTDLSWNGALPLSQLTNMGTEVGLSRTSYNSNLMPSGRTTSLGNKIFESAYGYDQDGLLICAGRGSTCSAENSVRYVFDCSTSSNCTGTALLQQITAGLVSQGFIQNSYGEVAEMSVTAGTGSPLTMTLEDEAHVRDGEGRVTRKSINRAERSITQDYSYDVLGHLSSVVAKVDGGSEQVRKFIYDDNGNRLCVRDDLDDTDCVGAEQSVYDERDRLVLDEDGNEYSYTEAGALRQRVGPRGDASYVYDALGNLTRVQTGGKDFIYSIDAFNRRVRKSVQPASGGSVQETHYLWESQLQIAAQLKGGQVLHFIYGNSVTTPELVVTEGGTTYRVISDQLGSPLLIVNVADPSDVLLDADYDEWGNVIHFNGITKPTRSQLASWPIPQGFAGGLYEPETGLVRFGARDYDPSVGRWTAKDPILFGGGQTNLYVYVGNDPVNFFDPYGRDAWSVAGNFAAGVAVGAVGAVAVAGLAVGAVTVGVPAAVVTGALFGAAAIGGAVFAYDTAGDAVNGNWDGVAFNAGSLLGGAGVGSRIGGALASRINGVVSPKWTFRGDKANWYRSDYPEGSVGKWIKSGFDNGSAGFCPAVSSAGAASAGHD